MLLKNSSGNIVDKYKFNGSKTIKIKYKSITSRHLDDVKPRNIKQELYFDLLQDASIPVKVVSGVAGSGKTFLSTAWALQEIENGHYNKLVIVKNNVSVQDVPDIGSVPGDVTEKLMAYTAFIGDIISIYGLRQLIEAGKIEIAYLGTMRGRSLSDSIILCSEAQNLTTSLTKMIITRVGEKSTIIWDYDLDQIDKKNFEKDNGMLRLTEALAGNPLFGMVEFDRIERSSVARLAELI